MLSLIRNLKDAAERRGRYWQIHDEIARMSRREAADIGIFPEDADRIAREAVYGKAA